MIAKRADSLPEWSIEGFNSGKYGPNVVVFHKPKNSNAGYAYRAKLDFNKEHPKAILPPSEAEELWSIDKTYASEWKEDGVYGYYQGLYGSKDFATRVYYSNGKTAYVYKTTPRYFGGKEPPNKEVDEDGFRTWEIEQNYSVVEDSLQLPRRFPNWTFPVPVAKKLSSGISSWWDSERVTNLDAETLFPWTTIGSNINIQETPLFSTYTNVFESNPYDDKTYSFFEIGGSGSNVWVKHRKKGVHFTQVLREKESVPTSDKIHYKRQIQGTRHLQNYANHYTAFGFSCEFWQTRPDNEWEFHISNSTLKPSFNSGNDSPVSNWSVGMINERGVLIGLQKPILTTDPFNLENPFTILGPQVTKSNSLGFWQDITTYAGDVDASKIPVYLRIGDSTITNKPQWLSRELKIHLLTASISYRYQERYSPFPPPDGTRYYEQKWGNYSKSITTLTFYTNEQYFAFNETSQPFPFGGHYPYIGRIGSVDLSGFVRLNTTTFVYIVGIEIS